ncbi:VOC family protein [Streptomyces sp. BE308]|uniref:VOC family protein n=1 Tax=Streptomyces sp. BE308 TaxID=3002529 RepID=UPI002E775DB9|nr:VOC family protein [Streptomyces sp. BE308]MEE1795890.1 VOC family protein [Streptomyces sp. BE308]
MGEFVSSAPQTRNQHAVDAGIDHITLSVGDARARAAEFVDRYGFEVIAAGDTPEFTAVAVRQRDVVLVLLEGRTDDHPATLFTTRHGDGVSDIALLVDEPDPTVLEAFGDVTHTFVSRPAGGPWSLPGIAPVRTEETTAPTAPAERHLLCVDHIAVCVENGELERTVESYRRLLGWQVVFEEDIHVGAQAMQSKVVQSPCGRVTLTLLQPMSGAAPGQIDDFLKKHGGSGVQHLAFAVPDIVDAVADLGTAGVRFLSTPDTYYENLEQRHGSSGHPVSELREHSVLVDRDHDGELFQIFTRSEHPRRTLFMEIIERRGATTFGSNNIRKLYEAVERQDRA